MSGLNPNLLAIAGSNSEVMIFDIANPAAPSGSSGDAVVALYQPAAAGGQASSTEALCVKFNNQNQKIVAVGFSNGHTHVCLAPSPTSVLLMLRYYR